MNRKRFFNLIKFKEWRFLQLSVLFILIMFISPYIGSWLVRIATGFAFLNSILVVYSTEAHKSVHNRTVLGLWILTVVCSILPYVIALGQMQYVVQFVETMAGVIVLIILAVDIVQFIIHKDEITFDAAFAATTVYLMIAYLFTLVYTFIYIQQPDSFRLPEQSTNVSVGNIKHEMFYFSIVTLATLGYGDILPTSNLTRTLVVIEAVSGQFFVAVVVAIVVSKLVIKMSKK